MKDKPEIRCLKLVGVKDWYEYIVNTLDDAQAFVGKKEQMEVSRNRALEFLCILYWDAKNNGYLD